MMMSKKIKKNALLSLLLVGMSIFEAPLLSVSAKDNEVKIDGKVYTLDSSNKYYYSQIKNYSNTSSGDASVGTFMLRGDIKSDGKKNGYTSFNSSNGEVELVYDFNYSENDDKEWHLVKDDISEVNGTDVEGKVNLGAITLQISFDGEKWTDVSSVTDVFSSKASSINPFYKTYDNQIMNGCYFRVLVAYKMKKTTQSGGVLGIGKKELSNRFVEVYEFYLHSNELSDVIEAASAKSYYRIGPGEIVQKVEKDTGYSVDIDFDKNDPHKGWILGDFYIKGFSGIQETDEEITFLKNPGDRITISFSLAQDIKRLNGNKKLMISNDYNGRDDVLRVSTPEGGFKRGALIIGHVDSHQNIKTQLYTDYLAACASKGADTTVQIFEEGDYLISLDYEIRDTRGLEKFCNYYMYFEFSIRNSDAMIFFLDTKTNSTLENNAYTPNGFKVDFANSKYLNVNIEKQNLNNDKLTTDPSFNRVIADGSEFSDEGIYLITAENPTTKTKTEWTIYVGNNPVLKAYAKNSGSYSIKEINQYLRKGYTIDGDGSLIPPKIEEVEDESEE